MKKSNILYNVVLLSAALLIAACDPHNEFHEVGSQDPFYPTGHPHRGTVSFVFSDLWTGADSVQVFAVRPDHLFKCGFSVRSDESRYGKAIFPDTYQHVNASTGVIETGYMTMDEGVYNFCCINAPRDVFTVDYSRLVSALMIKTPDGYVSLEYLHADTARSEFHIYRNYFRENYKGPYISPNAKPLVYGTAKDSIYCNTHTDVKFKKKKELTKQLNISLAINPSSAKMKITNVICDVAGMGTKIVPPASGSGSNGRMLCNPVYDATTKVATSSLPVLCFSVDASSMTVWVDYEYQVSAKQKITDHFVVNVPSSKLSYANNTLSLRNAINVPEPIILSE